MEQTGRGLLETYDMNQLDKAYRSDLDLLKGFAILAVVLYHMKISKSGYLGVDVFFAINGFLIVPKIIQSIQEGKFNYWLFLEKRIVRLLPLLLIVSAVSLLVGYWGMLPDDYENLSEGVVATNIFSNNILSSITTKNYWKVANDYRPLMHTWYIGILMEFYLIYPLIVLLVKWLSKKCQFGFYKYVVLTTLSLSVLSFLLYLSPSVSSGDKFYLIQYRFFEIAFGGLAGLWVLNHRHGNLYNNGVISGIAFVVLSFILFCGIFSIGDQTVKYDLVFGERANSNSFMPLHVLLLSTVMLTIFLMVCNNTKSFLVKKLIDMRLFCLLGIASYSIFIWHQPFLSYYRYFFTKNLSIEFITLFLAVLFVLSYISYRFIERKVKITFQTRIIVLVSFLIINAFAGSIYMRAGVVRDVPELLIEKNSIQRNMHAAYVDRISKYDKDFPNVMSQKKNVLIIGNSFGRDWGNVLLESKIASKINLSYIYSQSLKIRKDRISRIRKADYIFVFGWKHDVPYYVWENMKPHAEVWGLGTKNFGECNGAVYKNRSRSNYFQQTVLIDPVYYKINELLKAEWNDKYIDFLGLVTKDGKVQVFSDNHLLISQDCAHLTKGGAIFFANRIDLNNILQISD